LKNDVSLSKTKAVQLYSATVYAVRLLVLEK